MLRLAAMNEVGVSFVKAPTLKCVCTSDTQEGGMKEAMSSMKACVRTLEGAMLECELNKDQREAIMNQEKTGVLVVSDRSCQDYGAICLFFDGVLDALHQMIGDFYALPCSIHEWLVLPKEQGMLDSLRDMVKAVNEKEVPMSDRLSDDVFEYDGSNFKTAL